MRMIRRKLCSGFAVAGLLCVGFPPERCLADVVFQADFSGPGNGRSGSPYGGVTTGGFLSELKSDAYTLTRVTGGNPMASAGGYLSCSIVSNAPAGLFSPVKFTPDSPSNSLDAMTSVIGGDRVLNGAIDFFFRSDRDITKYEFRPLDASNLGQGGLRLILSSTPASGVPGLQLDVISNENGLRTGGDAGGLTKQVGAVGPFAMHADTVYHLGLTFATDAEGTVTAKVWAQAGTNGIDLAAAAPVATLTFGINEAVVTSGLPTGDFYLGQIRYENIPASMRQEFDRFRIHNALPAVLGPLEAPADVGWSDAESALVLQADFSGPGGGTGGKSDLATLGATGELVDAGTYSDASVITNAPFRPYSGGYLSVLTTNNALGGVYGRAKITPAAEASSLAAMSLVTNGQRVVRGGMDFFFRTDRTVALSEEFRPIDSGNLSAGGLRLILNSEVASRMSLQLVAPTGSSGIQNGDAGGTWVDQLSYSFVAPIQADTLYHFGLSFHARGDSGSVTAAVWLKEGTGAIDLRRDIPVGATTFGLAEAVVTNGFTAGFFEIGKLRQSGAVPNRQDFDCLRVYRGAPSVFAELPSPAPRGTVIAVR